jgi:cysteine-rich repeat protein
VLLVLTSGTARAASNPLLGPRGTFDWTLLAGLEPELWSGKVTIKLAAGLGPRLEDLAIVDANGIVVLDIESLFPAGSVVGVVQGFGLDLERLHLLRRTGEMACRCELADMADYFDVVVDRDAVSLPDVLDALNASPCVEVAYPACDHSRLPPPEDIPPPTPSYTTAQGYRAPAPGGIGVEYAWGYDGGRGAGTRVVDIEIGWDPDHEDLDACEGGLVPGIGTLDTSERRHTHHGLAVSGVMFGGDNGYGVTGIVPEGDCHFAPELTLEHYIDMPRAIMVTTGFLPASGTVILLEAQSAGPNYDYTTESQDGLVPVEWEPAVYDAIRTAVTNGYTVVEAAGNGRENLDDSRYYADLFDREYRDSGAIIVGGGTPATEAVPRLPEWFTNWGSRVDVQGWGSQVVSAGYGDLWNGGDIHQTYTAQFGGTSSASPIVAGAAASLIGIHKALTGEDPTPLQVRDVLVATGSPQAASEKHIGPLPNLATAVGTLVPVCGDWIVHEDEVCDDGNTNPGDGCSADCLSDETCGNSVVDEVRGEVCDDGNLTDLDGCSANCLSDETCGNGYLDTLLAEVCDDGNNLDADGCSADCSSDESCGNGILDDLAGEECDDGNDLGGDGCSRTCRKESKGCGCGLLPSGPPPASAILVLLLLVLALRTRRP